MSISGLLEERPVTDLERQVAPDFEERLAAAATDTSQPLHARPRNPSPSVSTVPSLGQEK